MSTKQVKSNICFFQSFLQSSLLAAAAVDNDDISTVVHGGQTDEC